MDRLLNIFILTFFIISALHSYSQETDPCGCDTGLAFGVYETYSTIKDNKTETALKTILVNMTWDHFQKEKSRSKSGKGSVSYGMFGGRAGFRSNMTEKEFEDHKRFLRKDLEQMYKTDAVSQIQRSVINVDVIKYWNECKLGCMRRNKVGGPFLGYTPLTSGKAKLIIKFLESQFVRYANIVEYSIKGSTDNNLLDNTRSVGTIGHEFILTPDNIPENKTIDVRVTFEIEASNVPRITKSISIPKSLLLNPQIECSGPNTLFDHRDNQCYETVEISGKRWMAENLRFVINRVPDDFEKERGLKYTWHQAMNACPNGWRLPTKEEWVSLKDDYGDTSLDGGSHQAYLDLIESGRSNFNARDDETYWSSTDENSDTASWYFYVSAKHEKVNLTANSKMFYRYCRCVEK